MKPNTWNREFLFYLFLHLCKAQQFKISFLRSKIKKKYLYLSRQVFLFLFAKENNSIFIGKIKIWRIDLFPFQYDNEIHQSCSAWETKH